MKTRTSMRNALCKLETLLCLTPREFKSTEIFLPVSLSCAPILSFEVPFVLLSSEQIHLQRSPEPGIVELAIKVYSGAAFVNRLPAN